MNERDFEDLDMWLRRGLDGGTTVPVHHPLHCAAFWIGRAISKRDPVVLRQELAKLAQRIEDRTS